MGNIEHPTSNAEHPMGDAGPEAGAPRLRLPVQTVECLHRLVGGDARMEAMVLQFIAVQYGVQDLLHLPPHIATAILKRPADFLTAVKHHCEPELEF
jgi:hypothetical protein